MPLTPGTYNWTQVADTEDGMADRMSREALIYVGSPPEETWDQIGSGEDFDFRGFLDSQTAEAVAEIEREAGFELKFREADVGRGASGIGTVVEVAMAVGAFGSATATLYGTARLVRKAYHRIAKAKGYRPMISLGAAEHLAMADLIDRVGSEPHLLGLGDVRSHSPDRAFTGGDAFFVALTTESELHHEDGRRRSQSWERAWRLPPAARCCDCTRSNMAAAVSMAH